jgi:hypothetical protein
MKYSVLIKENKDGRQGQKGQGQERRKEKGEADTQGKTETKESLGSCLKIRSGFKRTILSLAASAPPTIKPISPASPSLPDEKTGHARADDGVFRQSLSFTDNIRFVVLSRQKITLQTGTTPAKMISFLEPS